MTTTVGEVVPDSLVRMSTYRLQPSATRPWWWGLFGATAIILTLPVILNMAVPTRYQTEEVILGTPGYSWEIPLGLSCTPSADSIGGSGWYCGDVYVQTIIAEGGTDPDRTLRRMMRALNTSVPAESTAILREDQSRLLVDAPVNTVGISLEGQGQQEGQTMVTVVTGPGAQVAPLADLVWRSYTDGEGLPGLVMEAIADLDYSTALPWGVSA
ncbi:hypothetical protein [Corynebacterium alimapuense]|uniref:Uncharacterized protein n=1 Tax=Corynebacterium alimapuense TaxID=1576874 RepID=A0A3M8K533_9CORY|nr:hypothetical protein [Corynebacterium alimapuense]RNE48210.1 hypothetical protein C5L39_10110 [Corynebacterium alimapuense]